MRLRREMWMSDQYAMFGQTTCGDTPSATSSPGVDSGPSPDGLPGSPTTGPGGAEAVPALHSRRRAKAAGLMTLVTSGLLGSNSSASAALQSSLESRLIRQLDTAGSTLFRQTWKRRRTPLGRRYLEHTVSARRTSGNGCISLASWYSPAERDYKDTPGMATTGMNPDGSERSRLDQLPRQVMLATWNTPRATDGSNGGPNQAGGALSADVVLAAWPTPLAHKITPSQREDFTPNLASVATFAAWTTPTATDGKRGGCITESMTGSTTAQQAQSAVLGPMPSGFLAAIQRYPEQLSGGLLNGSMSLWLQGIPHGWTGVVRQAQANLKASKMKGKRS